MGCLSIKAEVLAGTDIEKAIGEAIWLARTLSAGVTITINFNGCLLNLHSNDEISEKVKEYEQWLKKPD